MSAKLLGFLPGLCLVGGARGSPETRTSWRPCCVWKWEVAGEQSVCLGCVHQSVCAGGRRQLRTSGAEGLSESSWWRKGSPLQKRSLYCSGMGLKGRLYRFLTPSELIQHLCITWRKRKNAGATSASSACFLWLTIPYPGHAFTCGHRPLSSGIYSWFPIGHVAFIKACILKSKPNTVFPGGSPHPYSPPHFLYLVFCGEQPMHSTCLEEAWLDACKDENMEIFSRFLLSGRIIHCLTAASVFIFLLGESCFE